MCYFNIDVDCYNKDNNGSTYIGTVNIASNNQTCLNWRTVSSPYVTYDKNNAFCRNPNGFKKPWCYTGAGFQFSYCNISVCGTLNIWISKLRKEFLLKLSKADSFRRRMTWTNNVINLLPPIRISKKICFTIRFLTKYYISEGFNSSTNASFCNNGKYEKK